MQYRIHISTYMWCMWHKSVRQLDTCGVYYKFCLVRCCNFQLFWSPVGHSIEVLRHFCTLCVIRTSLVVKFTIFRGFITRKYFLKIFSPGKLCTLCKKKNSSVGWKVSISVFGTQNIVWKKQWMWFLNSTPKIALKHNF